MDRRSVADVKSQPAPFPGHPRTRILIVGAGHVGLYVALRLSKILRPSEAEITVVDPQPHMTYQPFLPEAAAGSISPRHAVVPLRRILRDCRVLSGEVTHISHADRVATVQPIIGPAVEVPYDHVVVAPGSVSRTLPIPGLRENGVGFKGIGEAIWLRNHVLEQLDVAATTDDPRTRRRALSFVFIGGGYAGVEALAEMESMARSALRYYDLPPDGMRWVLVEATQRILPEVDIDMGRYAVDEMRSRGIEVRLETKLESCVDGVVQLSDGETFEADTIVWTAGVKPSPMLQRTDLPRDDKGRITCSPTLQVIDAQGSVVPGAWSAGDCAAVPDLTSNKPGAFCSPSAQHAVRQARLLADNIRAVMRGVPVRRYRHKYAGSVASLGLYQGVAQVYGIKARGWLAWFMHRTYHLSRVPSLNRKIRVVADWTLALFLRREVVSLGGLHAPRAEFTDVTPHVDPKPAQPEAKPAQPVPATARH